LPLIKISVPPLARPLNPAASLPALSIRRIPLAGLRRGLASYFQLSFSSIHGQRPPYSGNCSSMATLSSASARVRVASRVRPSLLMTFQIPLYWMILISLVLLSSCCSLCIRDRTERIRKWFAIDSNFKQPSLNRTDRAPPRKNSTPLDERTLSTNSGAPGLRSSLVDLAAFA
jgi:hypothetical protein